MMRNKDEVIEKVSNTVIEAALTFKEEQKRTYRKAIDKEKLSRAKLIMENTLKNEEEARRSQITLCDDTGIPHLLLEIGKKDVLTGEMMDWIHEGVAEGLRKLPGRPMAVKGNDIERLEQSQGMSDDPGALVSAPLIVKRVDTPGVRLHILLQGGGPEIRSRTYRIFHKHKVSAIVDEIVRWAKEEVAQLGCTPCVPSIGIGRTHFEATSMMIEAMVHGKFDVQSDIEKEITSRINESNVGPLGLKGDTTALATFLKVGPQRASGVRIVCLRLSCNIEPRVSSVEL